MRRRTEAHAVTKAENNYDYAGQDPINGYDLSGLIEEIGGLAGGSDWGGGDTGYHDPPSKGNRGGSRPVETGRQGEAGVPGEQNHIAIEVNGRRRIPDRLNSNNLGEIKNVRYQSLTQQIRDEESISESSGRTFTLWIRSNTVLSRPLQAFIRDNNIRIRYISGR